MLIIALWLGNLELGVSNLGFKPYVFNSRFLTQSDIFQVFNLQTRKKPFSDLLLNRPTTSVTLNLFPVQFSNFEYPISIFDALADVMKWRKNKVSNAFFLLNFHVECIFEIYKEEISFLCYVLQNLLKNVIEKTNKPD